MKIKNKKRNLYIIVVILVITTITFRLLNDLHLEQTSILFVGIPALLTLLLIKYTKTPKTAYGTAFYVTTLFLLMCGILLGEGLVCIIIMAPIFYGIVALIIFLATYIKSKNKLHSFILIPVLLFVADVGNINSIPEINSIETKMVINTNSQLSSLNNQPDFLQNFPTFFKIGFPKPISIKGKGINIGDSRKIEFLSNTKGIGILHLKVKQKNENTLIYEVIEDTTHMNHWLTINEVIVKIENLENKTSIVTWTTKFTCDLGPSWYFKPLEKYAVNIMNKHLIDSYFN